ncbi:MAG TPA: ACT domain-containing protein [Syntrophomonas sp.]|nr:ACT domain-containing protein [Syntrophomonas sp.]HCF70447.1 ACT domain-containing protein [Syntrophomonas sp.]
MGKPDKKFYMVREDILPESILKTALAKEMLASGEVDSIMAAVDRLEMSRSTFYKYKDGIYSFFNAENLNIINVSMMLKNTPGVLSSILNRVAQLGANVLTINQNLPIHGAAYVTISLSVEELNVSVDDMLREFKKVDGVLGAEIVGKS